MRDGRIVGEFVPGEASEHDLARGDLCLGCCGPLRTHGNGAGRGDRRDGDRLLADSPYFLTMPNLVDLVEAYSVTTILAAGVFVVLVSGGIDISFTATASATQYLAAYLRRRLRRAGRSDPGDRRRCSASRWAASTRC